MKRDLFCPKINVRATGRIQGGRKHHEKCPPQGPVHKKIWSDEGSLAKNERLQTERHGQVAKKSSLELRETVLLQSPDRRSRTGSPGGVTQRGKPEPKKRDKRGEAESGLNIGFGKGITLARKNNLEKSLTK